MSGGAHILVVEDDRALAGMLTEELESAGYEVEACRSAEAALARVDEFAPELVISDLQLPRRDGMALLESLSRRPGAPAFLMITAFGTVERAVAALKAGADNFLTKPLDMEHLLVSCQRLIETRRLRAEVERFRGLFGEGGFHGLLGDSPAMRALIDQIGRIAGANGPVLITGASGTGKEMVARALHAESPRADKPFLAVNCAGVPADLLESEFFGYSAGAFTGAERSRPGLFREADGGTLFLDEIGEMPAALQAKLLRALENGRIRPVGDDREAQVDVRMVAATNLDLAERVREGGFREDLYFRLETFQIRVPDLAGRVEDIELLARHFLARFAAAADRPARELSSGALGLLRDYPWPGNVRELRNVMERAVTFCNAETVGPEHLPERLSTSKRSGDEQVAGDGIPAELLAGEFLPSLEELRRRYVRYVLRQVGGNKRRAAALLGIGRRTLYRWLEHEGGAGP